MVNDSEYYRPREKLQARGVAALSDTELLQLLIGSGNAKASVANIARKTNRALKKYGSDISYDQLSQLSGLGVARTANILAAFELARRYPVKRNQLTLTSPGAISQLLDDARLFSTPSVTYVTADGARRIIAKRSIQTTMTLQQRLRTIIAHVLSDNAVHLIVIETTQQDSVVPDLDHLQFAKELQNITSFFSMTRPSYYLVNKSDHHVVLDT